MFFRVSFAKDKYKKCKNTVKVVTTYEKSSVFPTK